MNLIERRELPALRQRYAVQREELQLGGVVLVIAYGYRPYRAIVTEIGPRLAQVEFRTRVGIRTRRLPFAEIFKPDALERLRGENLGNTGDIEA